MRGYMCMFVCVCVLVCNNGGGGEIVSRVKRSVGKWMGTRKRVFRRKNEKSPSPCGMFETQEIFPEAYFTHTTTYAYLPLFMGYWNMQECSDSNLFWAGYGRFHFWRFSAILHF